ncbi:hypothetical protein TraAM80_03449 [Trypanosoma rangeli]|uniref:Uncharacterized protein n=1 Tax=Trypanosoma rangeli TaxID=5698 RepID=A0A3R7M1I4_TRYRA|nr:uncharacterized protein TraAM80_03449 [Trypanosoma rangeli]RNF07314.1 hypothetical protein TraAM80_03449 [Trypanosoma rangeli]|eukprot:RNF07314.1 hypothetical protein TraAM80_03449 [Trypanosoma rangeli]
MWEGGWADGRRQRRETASASASHPRLLSSLYPSGVMRIKLPAECRTSLFVCGYVNMSVYVVFTGRSIFGGAPPPIPPPTPPEEVSDGGEHKQTHTHTESEKEKRSALRGSSESGDGSGCSIGGGAVASAQEV